MFLKSYLDAGLQPMKDSEEIPLSSPPSVGERRGKFHGRRHSF